MKNTLLYILSVAGMMIIVFQSIGCFNDQKLQLERVKLIKTAGKIEHAFVEIRKEVEHLAFQIKELYLEKNKAINLQKCDKSKYKLSESGIFYKPVDDGGTLVLISGAVPIDEKLKQIIYFTEPLDDIFAKIMKKKVEISQCYYIDRFSTCRVYPYINVLTQFEPKLDLTLYNFYYLADKKHNPEKKGTWVNEPYVDVAGHGWIISAIAPYYIDDDILEGVVGLDVTVETIEKRYLSDKDTNLMLISSDGVVITANYFLINLFSLPSLTRHKYLDTVKLNTYRKDDYNLLKSKTKNVRTLATKIIQNKEKKVFFKSIEYNNQHIVLIEQINELDWYLLKVIKG